VVDNGSSDGSEAAIRERFPDLDLLQTGDNLGYTGGNNAGMRRALAAGADHVILLNNDTEVHPEFVDALLEAQRLDPATGMVCSKIYFFGAPDRFWYAGASFHPWIGWGRHRGFDQVDRGQYDSIETTDRATGCALMVTRELCERIGLLREEYFAYCEDLDWSLRARHAGFRIVYVPRSRVWHKVARASGGTASGISHYYFTRNMLLCLDENLPLPHPLRALRWAAVIAAALLGVVTQRIPVVRGWGNVLSGARDYFGRRLGRRAARA
jgi:GT2 family glycosyltransferase